jgi:hypothetical protein
LNGFNDQLGFEAIGKGHGDGDKQKREEWLDFTIGNQHNQQQNGNTQKAPHSNFIMI